METFTLRSLIFRLTLLNICSSLSQSTFSEVPLTLGPHPDGLTCTLNMQILQSTYIDILEKLIEDNQPNSLFFIFANDTRAIPLPSVHFQEQCTFNFIVGDMHTFGYVDYCTHSQRSPLHSTFIMVTKVDCSTLHDIHRQRAYIFRWWSPRIYFHFWNCEKTSPTIFPNAYINPFNSFDGPYNLIYAQNRDTFSWYSFETLKHENQYNQYLCESFTLRKIRAELPYHRLKKYCRT